ncbi:MAG: exodeoxyribonuclease VII small subunit [Thermorudis peleae]|nr:exodeoxyribonuclease VII small subunit [Thermorudis peleae]
MADEHSAPFDGEQPAIEVYEQLVAEIEQIVQRLESGTLTLTEALQEYQRGIELIRLCNSILDQAELKITELATGLTLADGQAPPMRGDYTEYFQSRTLHDEFQAVFHIENEPDDELN